MTGETCRRIDLDLLIIGGGIQGLTLLHHYNKRRGGSAILVSRDPLGSGETLHSHGYLHRGYVQPPEFDALIADIGESFDWWDHWMRRHSLRYEIDAPILFDIQEQQYDTVTASWAKTALEFEQVDRLPEALQGGCYSRPGHRRKLVQIHDRLIQPSQIVETLGAPLQHLLLQGELEEISCEGGRIVDCVVSTPEEIIHFRPSCLVLAAGRDTQRILKKIKGPGGANPIADELRSMNRLREVPMVLIKGASLPALTGWFHPGCPLSVMSHPMENGERMWVVTLMEDHRTYREDFDNRSSVVDESMMRRTLHALQTLVPELKSRSADLQLSSYLGTKVDHPDGIPTWFMGNCGIENLRFVWPVLWGLAHGASQELIQGLPEPACKGSVPTLGTVMGIKVGEEYRLSPSRDWMPIADWKV